MQIIHTNFKSIHVNPVLLSIETPTNKKIDVYNLMMLDSSKELAYFNTAPILEQFNKKYALITRPDSWKEYVNCVQEHIKLNRENFIPMDDIFYNEDGTPKAIVSRRGRHGGTWLHIDLLAEFMGLVDVGYRFALDELFMTIIKNTSLLEIQNDDTKTLFHPLTDTIKDIYIPAQISENAKKFAYSTLLDLANKKALGRVSKVVMQDMGITKEQITEDGNISIRDYLSHAELELIKQAEEDINGLIKYARITDYQEIKERLGA